MEIKEKLLKIYSVKNKKIMYIFFLEEDMLLRKILIGIYLIESNYRNIFYRFAEYIIVVLKLIFCDKQIKNYTIGIMQVGLANILRHYNYYEYDEHEKFLKNISVEKAKNILKGMYWKNSIRISKALIEDWYFEYKNKNYSESTIVGLIGEKYNGTEGYALLLLDIVKRL